jgi:hypothetical protein
VVGTEAGGVYDCGSSAASWRGGSAEDAAGRASAVQLFSVSRSLFNVSRSLFNVSRSLCRLVGLFSMLVGLSVG